MPTPTHVLSAGLDEQPVVRIAAAGDLHVDASRREAAATALAAMARDAEYVLIAGDLTTHGEPDQTACVAEACRGLDATVVCVLGNHDLHADRGDEVTTVLRDAGVVVLDTAQSSVVLADGRLGIAGVKGFVGGFGRATMPDFGERSLRAVHAETGREVAALDEGLRAIAGCPVRVALLHYAPVAETLVGEPEDIWTFLGSERLAAPLQEHRPDLVLHGHAHAGTFEGRLGEVPVHNVSLPVMRQDYWRFDLHPVHPAGTPVH